MKSFLLVMALVVGAWGQHIMDCSKGLPECPQGETCRCAAAFGQINPTNMPCKVGKVTLYVAGTSFVGDSWPQCKWDGGVNNLVPVYPAPPVNSDGVRWSFITKPKPTNGDQKDSVDVPPIFDDAGKAFCRKAAHSWRSRLDCEDANAFTCADKTRFLMTSEDGKRHCLRMGD